MQSCLPFKCIRLYQSICPAKPSVRSNANRVVRKLWVDFDDGEKGGRHCSEIFILICFRNITSVIDLEQLWVRSSTKLRVGSSQSIIVLTCKMLHLITIKMANLYEICKLLQKSPVLSLCCFASTHTVCSAPQEETAENTSCYTAADNTLTYASAYCVCVCVVNAHHILVEAMGKHASTPIKYWCP